MEDLITVLLILVDFQLYLMVRRARESREIMMLALVDIFVWILAVIHSNKWKEMTASYEELLAAVKSGRFTVDKTNKNKGSNEDLLQEILDKSKFCYFKQTTISRPSGKT